MQLDLKKFPYLGDPVTQKIFQVFAEAGSEARLVGGCVRDALLGIVAYDIDIAVPLPPDEVIKILKDAHVKVIPTGYKFGTVTALWQGRAFQITSLRKDWQTDGRHARVIYGTDWSQDAARRDFTINALYADMEGIITDYFEGIADLKSGTIRFIGEATQRIREDYLRILRYFRFLAWYGGKEKYDGNKIDDEALRGCRELKQGLAQLSRERIGQEFLKLLGAPFPLPSLSLLNECGIIPYILPEPVNLPALERLVSLENTPQVMRRLAALVLPDINIADLTKALCLSTAQKSYLEKCQARVGAYPPSAATLNRNLYKDYTNGNTALFVDLTLLALALEPNEKMKDMAGLAFQAGAQWQQPAFPLTGGDLIALGLSPNPEFGSLLQACEEWWIDQNFQPEYEECIQWIKKFKAERTIP